MREGIKIGVLMGGVSSEREISLASGRAVVEGLRLAGYEVVAVDVTSDEIEFDEPFDLAFIALHGRFGEDGDVQRQLVSLGIPFTGSSAESCAVSFDKVKTRAVLRELGLPVAAGEVLGAMDSVSLPFPVVVKPPCEGSSVGCHVVRTEEDWQEALEDALQFGDQVLVERFIEGRELTVGIVGDVVLPVVEVVPEGDWFHFDAKYRSQGTSYEVPAILGGSLAGELQSLAWDVFRGLNAEGMGRVDFRLHPEEGPFVLELNAIPGFTQSSLLPKAAAAVGISFPELCSRIVEDGFERSR